MCSYTFLSCIFVIMLVSSPMKCFLCQKHQILLKYIFVIVAVSDAIADLFESVRMIFAAGEKERTEGSAGFILVTSFTMSKVHSFLVSEGVSPTDFDAYICNSGADLYYSSPQSEENPLLLICKYLCFSCYLRSISNIFFFQSNAHLLLVTLSECRGVYVCGA